LHLLLEEYGVTSEYLPEKKDTSAVVGALSRLDVENLKIQEEALRIFSKSEISNIINIKSIILMYTALNFKE
jgi:hypothetical protein